MTTLHLIYNIRGKQISVINTIIGRYIEIVRNDWTRIHCPVGQMLDDEQKVRVACF